MDYTQMQAKIHQDHTVFDTHEEACAEEKVRHFQTMLIFFFFFTQQNFGSISHLLGTMTTQWLDSDHVITIVNCRQHGRAAWWLHSWSTV